MPPKLLRTTRSQMIAGPGGHEPIPEVSAQLHGLSGVLPRLIEADVDRVETDAEQPRTVFDEEALRSLAASIATYGLQQPILVRETEDLGRYRLVAGERRLRAHRMLGRTTIPAIITKGKPEEIALIENVQRVDLDVFDLARGMSQLIDKHGYTQAEAGAIVGCSVNEVSRRLKVLELPDRIRDEYRAQPELVTRSAIYEIVVVDGPEEQLRLWEIAKRGSTVQQMRNAARPSKPKATPEALTVLGKSIRRIDKELTAIDVVGDQMQKEHRDLLRDLRDRMTALIGE